MYVLAMFLQFMPIVLEEGTFELNQLDIHIPIRVPPQTEKELRKLSLYFSTDRGKTWKYLVDWKRGTDTIKILVPEDGLYWFSLRTINKDGKATPKDVKNLSPDLKIYVNSSTRPVLNREKSYKELEQEVAELRETVKELRRKLKELQTQSHGGK